MVREQSVRLDRARIVDAALTIAARDGAPAVTMRRIGTELGVDATAFYRHFRTKDDLVVAMAEQLFERELERIDLSGTWRENLSRLLWGGWRVYREHPGFAETLARLPDDLPCLSEMADRSLAELRRAGLTAADAALVYHSTVDVVAGTGLFLAIAPTFAEAGHRAGLRDRIAALPAAAYPALDESAEYLYPPVEDVFASSVELLLDAIQLRSERARAQRHEEER